MLSQFRTLWQRSWSDIIDGQWESYESREPDWAAILNPSHLSTKIQISAVRQRSLGMTSSEANRYPCWMDERAELGRSGPCYSLAAFSPALQRDFPSATAQRNRTPLFVPCSQRRDLVPSRWVTILHRFRTSRHRPRPPLPHSARPYRAGTLGASLDRLYRVAFANRTFFEWPRFDERVIAFVRR